MKKYEAYQLPGYHYLWGVFDVSVLPPVQVWPNQAVIRNWTSKRDAKRMARRLNRRFK